MRHKDPNEPEVVRQIRRTPKNLVEILVKDQWAYKYDVTAADIDKGGTPESIRSEIMTIMGKTDQLLLGAVLTMNDKLDTLNLQVHRSRALILRMDKQAYRYERYQHLMRDRTVRKLFRLEMHRLEALHGPCPKRVKSRLHKNYRDVMWHWVGDNARSCWKSTARRRLSRPCAGKKTRLERERKEWMSIKLPNKESKT